MTKLLYVDAIAGLAGDMLLAALLDAGADVERVRAGLHRLGVEGLGLQHERTTRQGIAAARVTVTGAAEERAHRRWADVRALIERAELPPRACERALAIFAALARAEGAVHGVEPETVHFHEVGAIDAIGDVCGIALALEDLAIDELVCSPLPLARGQVEAAHGCLPLPAPATLELLRGAPLLGAELDVELVTPTGAAVVSALAASWGSLPPLRLAAIGYGAGARELADRPNVVRVLCGQRVGGAERAGGAASADAGMIGEDIVEIESNLDDISPELVPDAVERCFAAGALDVWLTSVQMKKGRPGIVLSALARPAAERAVIDAIVRETTTLGVRVRQARRWALTRQWLTVQVDGAPVRVKLGMLDGEVVNAAPEHDDCAAVARASGRAVKDVWAAALAAAQRERTR